MSDQQPSNKFPEEPEIKGGWRKPQTAGGWRQLEPRPVEDGEDGGWRVPAMPTNLNVAPAKEGAWHLPRPEDTVFTPEDEIEIKPARPENLRPEDIEPEIPVQAAIAIAPEEADEEDDDDLESFSGLGELMMLVSQVEQPAPASLVLSEAPAAPEAEAEPDFTGPATAEREALAQATDAAEIARRQVEQLSVTPEVDLENDSAEIARRQVEQLSSGAAATPIISSADDPGAIARRQVELLSGSQPVTPISEITPVEPAVPIDLEREALAQKFLETEGRVRALRQQYQAGQITRDQLQEQLRQLLILDNNDVWWMMGVDSDTWYRFDSQVNDWVPDAPPRPTAPRTVTSELNPEEVIRGSLPYLPEDNEVTSPTGYQTGYASEPISPDFDDVMMPKAVPIQDPDYTVPGMGAVRLDDVRQSDAPTLDATQPYPYGETIRSEPVASDATTYSAVAGYDAAEKPPEYSLGVAGDEYQRAVELQRQSVTRQVLLIGSLIVGGGFILGALVVAYMIITYNNIASEYTDEVIALANYQPAFQTARILDAQGNLLAELNSQEGGARRKVSLADISPEAIYAVVASENERFYEDPGYDVIAIARAFVQNFSSSQVASGASTITQQVASKLILLDEGVPTAEQKLREIIIASEIARRYDKNFILELYLNEVFFGNQSYGIEAASEFYFDKEATELNLAESALLAGLISAPNTYDPVTNPTVAFDRMDDVLRTVASVPCLNFQHPPYVNDPYCIASNTILKADDDFTGTISIDRSRVEIRKYLPRTSTVRYPHFIQFVLAQLERQFGSDEIYRRGFEVRTTLVPSIQDAAQNALESMLGQIAFTGVNTGTVMVTDPRDGSIRAMIGSPNFSDTSIDGQVNLALTWQQPGSSIKPVVYTAAMEGVGDRNNNGALDYTEYFTPASILWDVPSTYSSVPPYSPVNFDGRFRGPISVRYALANSINVAAVKAYEFIGNEKFIDISQRLGLTFLNDPPVVGLPSGVGATEVRLYDMMQAYGTLANNGNYVPLYSIVSIKDSDGNDVLLESRPQPVTRVQPPVAYLIQNILSDNTARSDSFGANSPLFIPQFGDRIGAKTGTSNEARDLWTMGFSRNTVVGVWLGRPDNAPTRGGSFEHAAPVWNAVMKAALSTLPAPDPFASSNVFQVDICTLTGSQAGNNCPGGLRNEFFVVNQPPPPPDQGVVITIPIDTWSGLRATDACTENLENRTYVNIGDPFAIQWLASAAGQSTAQLLGLPIPPQAPPSGACDVNTVRPVARIASPISGEILQNTITIVGAVSVPQNFNRYQIDILSANAPNNVIATIGPFTNQVPNQGPLAQWDTTSVSNGVYILRLSVFGTAQSGGGYIYRPVQVTVQNILPTATPTQFIPTALPITATTIPIPLDVNGGNNAQGLGAPTPTATISLGG